MVKGDGSLGRVHLTLETLLRPTWEKGPGDVDAQRLLAEGANLPN